MDFEHRTVSFTRNEALAVTSPRTRPQAAELLYWRPGAETIWKLRLYVIEMGVRRLRSSRVLGRRIETCARAKRSLVHKLMLGDSSTASTSPRVCFDRPRTRLARQAKSLERFSPAPQQQQQPTPTPRDAVGFRDELERRAKNAAFERTQRCASARPSRRSVPLSFSEQQQQQPQQRGAPRAGGALSLAPGAATYSQFPAKPVITVWSF